MVSLSYEQKYLNAGLYIKLELLKSVIWCVIFKTVAQRKQEQRKLPAKKANLQQMLYYFKHCNFSHAYSALQELQFDV